LNEPGRGKHANHSLGPMSAVVVFQIQRTYTEGKNGAHSSCLIIIISDRGGTFTDVWASQPGKPDIVINLLSVDEHYTDAPTEGKLRASPGKIWVADLPSCGRGHCHA